MENNLGSIYTTHVVTSKNEFFGIACLAIIGAVSIVKSVANGAYRTGRDEREREMKRDIKKGWKQFRKFKKKYEKIES